MAKPNYIELGDEEQIPILYEDRSVMAIDKPAGWMLIPFSWQTTNRNLQAAITSSIGAGDFWARSRNLKYLRHIHRLDGDTTGILLLAKSQGALNTFSDLFESRKMDKTYLAAVRGIPKQAEWVCRLKLAPDPDEIGQVKVDLRGGKEAETHFKILQRGAETTLIEARPITGRTHQIRVHLAESGHPVLGDRLYGSARAPRSNANPSRNKSPLGLRAVSLAYTDPFTKRQIQIKAPTDEFLREFRFAKPLTNL
jgi:RluA family pseudouridine synthase